MDVFASGAGRGGPPAALPGQLPLHSRTSGPRPRRGSSPARTSWPSSWWSTSGPDTSGTPQRTPALTLRPLGRLTPGTRVPSPRWPFLASSGEYGSDPPPIATDGHAGDRQHLGSRRPHDGPRLVRCTTRKRFAGDRGSPGPGRGAHAARTVLLTAETADAHLGSTDAQSEPHAPPSLVRGSRQQTGRRVPGLRGAPRPGRAAARAVAWPAAFGTDAIDEAFQPTLARPPRRCALPRRPGRPTGSAV